MHKVSLRKVGGSIMLTIPPAFLDQLQLQAGAIVGLAVDEGRLMMTPQLKSCHTLAELLAVSDYTQSQMESDRDWIDAPRVGGELL